MKSLPSFCAVVAALSLMSLDGLAQSAASAVPATAPGAELVVSAMVGAVGLEPTLAAIRAGLPVGLANKETLVAAGPLVMALARERGVPVKEVQAIANKAFRD